MDGIQGSKIRNSCDSSLGGMKCNTAAEWGGACDLIMYYIINGSEKKNDGSNWILCGGGAQLSINWQKE